MKKFLNNLLSFFYPRLCIGCGDALQQNEQMLCLKCLTHLPETNYHQEHDNPLRWIFAGRVPVRDLLSKHKFDLYFLLYMYFSCNSFKCFYIQRCIQKAMSIGLKAEEILVRADSGHDDGCRESGGAGGSEIPRDPHPDRRRGPARTRFVKRLRRNRINDEIREERTGNEVNAAVRVFVKRRCAVCQVRQVEKPRLAVRNAQLKFASAAGTVSAK